MAMDPVVALRAGENGRRDASVVVTIISIKKRRLVRLVLGRAGAVAACSDALRIGMGPVR
jgi:hypothetical protein